MAGARDKLAAAIGNAKVVKAPAKKEAPAPKPPPPARDKGPARPAPPSGPPRPSKSADPPAEKPKKKGLFTKKKKAKPAAKAKSKEKEKAKPKAEKSGGGGFFHKFVDELKEATQEIKPKALLATAAESLQSLKSAVSPGSDSDAADVDQIGKPDPGTDEAAAERPAPSQDASATTQAPPPAADEPAEAPVEHSPAKVQRAPKKKPPKEKAEPAAEGEAGAPEEDAGAATDPSPPEGTGAEGGPQAEVTADASAEPPTADPVSTDETEPPEFSPTKVKKAQEPKWKKKLQDEAQKDEDTQEPPESPAAGEPEDEPVGAREDIGAQGEMEEPAGEAEEPRGEGQAQGNDDPREPAAEPEAEKSDGDKAKAKKPRPQEPTIKLSKTEQALRLFQSLHTLLRNPVWGPVVVDPEAKPSALYSPRDRFDAQFSDQVFREGLKAANKIAQAASFDPEKISFEERAVEAVKAFPLELEGRLKKDTDLLSKVLTSDEVKKVIKFFKSPQVRELLYSVGTRAGTFVPTIEILARIYLPMRKNEDMIPGKRLAIQEEVLLRYKNSPYTDLKAKKARNLALNYFTDYLSGNAMKTFRERFENAPEGQNNAEARAKRHNVIKSHCMNQFDDRGVKLGLSSQSLIHVKARFSEMADLYFKEQIGDGAEELLEQFQT
jgi:hypothetical protein